MGKKENEKEKDKAKAKARKADRKPRDKDAIKAAKTAQAVPVDAPMATATSGQPALTIVKSAAEAPTAPATLRQRQGQLKQKYRVRPDSALLTSAAYSVTEEGQDPRRVRIAVDGPSGTVLEIGAHPGVGGFDEVPCSGDIFLASLAACQELTIRLVAAALSLPIHKLDVRVEGDWDVRGTLGVNRASPIGFTDLRLSIDLETEGSPERVERLLTSAEHFCVVGQTLKDAPELKITANVTNRVAESASAD